MVYVLVMETKTNIKTSEHTAIGLPAREAAALLGISPRHLWALNASARLPMPVRLGRSVRWIRAELEAWLEAGAPARDRWEATKTSGR